MGPDKIDYAKSYTASKPVEWNNPGDTAQEEINRRRRMAKQAR
jgi:hypothetical protein